ncbi:MAG: hypothetical protein QM604_00985, partial [Microbacterium sp.]
RAGRPHARRQRSPAGSRVVAAPASRALVAFTRTFARHERRAGEEALGGLAAAADRVQRCSRTLDGLAADVEAGL